MAQHTMALDDLVAEARKLPARDRLKLIEQVAASLEPEVDNRPTQRRSLYGFLAHLGPAPSAEEIDEARREAWANFPRDEPR